MKFPRVCDGQPWPMPDAFGVAKDAASVPAEVHPLSQAVIVVETTDACGRPLVIVRRPLVAGRGVHHMADPEDG